MKTVYLIHGLNALNDGAVSTDKLKPMLIAKGLKIVEIDYNGTKSLFWRKHNGTVAEDLASRITKKGTKPFAIMAHSNGADICERALSLLDPDLHPHNLVYINPAIKNNLKKPRGAFRQMIYFSKGDLMLPLGKLFAWGTLGRTGHIKPEDTQHSIDMSEVYAKKAKLKKVKNLGHKDFFNDKYLGILFSDLWKRMIKV